MVRESALWRRSAAIVFVGRPFTRISRRQVVLVNVRREARIVTKVDGGATVVSAVAHAYRIVIEDVGLTVRTRLVCVGCLNDRGHTAATRVTEEKVSQTASIKSIDTA